MKRFHSRILSSVLAAVLAISTVCAAPAMPQVQAQETNSGYEIYPNPQEVSYQEGEYKIVPIDASSGPGLDSATDKRYEEVLEKLTHTEAMSAGEEEQTKFFVDIYDSDDEVIQEIVNKYSIDETLFDHSGAYYLVSDNNEICLLGKDSDAVFYGLTTLKHILDQVEDDVIRNFTIRDYADTTIRGFIEGYYGIPWSNEDRMSLMEFGGEFKMTSYVFAPKDDPYHSAKWRELYPEEKLSEIAEMAAVGNASKCKFVWTIHPFMHSPITANTYDTDLQIIKTKFEQLYEAGVRQFGVLGDDAGSLPRNVIIRLMNDLQAWVDEKGDVYDLVFCPAGYNHAWQGNYSELNDYDAGFDPRIKIFWTGEAVCQPIEVKTLDHFRNQNAVNGQRRAPLFWLNWPVNDINMNRLAMGKGSLLHTDINPEDLAGAVTNPMQDAQASKVALFAVADYTWNIKGFDDDQSWADSFKYIEPDAAEALHTLAKHMSDPSPNNHGLVLAESEELKPLLDDFMAAYEAGKFDEEKAQNLIREFEVIIAACDEFHTLSKNTELKTELLPFTNALKDLCEANIAFLRTAKAFEAGNADASWANYADASAKLAASKNHDRITIDGTKKALPAAKWIRPFAEKLNTTLSGLVNTMIDDTKVLTTLITNRPNTPDGALENLTDNNEGTQVIWSNPNSAAAGDYIGLSYNKPITVNDITFKMGQSGNMRDTFQSAKVQYTEDGTTWIDIEGSEYTDRRALVEVEGLDIQAKGIRLIATEDMTNMWLGCRDIIVNKGSDEEAGAEVTKTIIRPGKWSVYSGNEDNLMDGSESNGIWYNTGASNDTAAGDFLGMDLGRVANLAKVKFAVGLDGGDKWENYHLEYSADGNEWVTVKSYQGKTAGQDVYEEDLTGVKARYVRIVNDTYKKCWVKFGEFDVEIDLSQGTSEYTYTNVEALKNLKAVHTPEETHFVGKSGITLKPGEYIGLKLERIKDITAINIDLAAGLTLQSSKNETVWTEVTADAKAYEDARYIRVINQSDADVTFDLTRFEVKSFELAPISVADKNTEFWESNGLEAFDNSRTTEVIFWSYQNKGIFVTYDLGQTIALNSLALVSRDSSEDFPKHAKISVSEDGESWTDVMTIGNQDGPNEGEAEGTDNIMDVLPIHDVSSNLKLAENLDVQARYLKFEITRDLVGEDKWIRYTEIELNGGNMFLPVVNDPTITTDAQQSEGNVKDNMIDGDLATTFMPVDDGADFFTYYISENTNQVGKVKILQSPSTVSNAKVTAEVIRKEGGKPETVALGTLDRSLNEFHTGAYANVLSVTVAWENGSVPKIHEIILAPGKEPTEPEEVIYTAYVDGEAVAEGPYNTRVELHADAEKDGKPFVCWMSGETVISMNRDYTFYLGNDVHLTAVYGEEEVKATASLINTLAMPADDCKVNARFVGQLALPEGAKLLDAGLVWSTKETPAELTLAADGVKVTHISAINTAYQFSVTINGMPKGRFVRGVIFAEVQLPDGTTTIYSGEATITNK